MLSFSEIPAEFADFVKAKQRELAFNMLSSSAVGVVGANLAALVAGRWRLDRVEGHVLFPGADHVETLAVLDEGE